MKQDYNCKSKKIAEQMVLYLYDELNEEEKRQLEKHVHHCRSCAEEFNKLKENFSLVTRASETLRVPDFDWNKSWWVIRSSIRKKSRKERPFLPVSGWALKLAAAVIIFLIGIFAGKILFFPGQAPQVPEVTRSADDSFYLASMYREYFEDVKTTIMEYANYRVEDKESSLLLFEKGRVKGLLSRSRLLKSYIKGDEYAVLKQLLDELEMILIEISNLTANNPEYLLFIKELLKEKEIIFKMKHVSLERLGSTNI